MCVCICPVFALRFSKLGNYALLLTTISPSTFVFIADVKYVQQLMINHPRSDQAEYTIPVVSAVKQASSQGVGPIRRPLIRGSVRIHF